MLDIEKNYYQKRERRGAVALRYFPFNGAQRGLIAHTPNQFKKLNFDKIISAEIFSEEFKPLVI